jgi:hypothetical protein
MAGLYSPSNTCYLSKATVTVTRLFRVLRVKVAGLQYARFGELQRTSLARAQPATLN